MRLGAVALVVGLVLDLGTGCGTSPNNTTGVVGKQMGAGGQSGDGSAGDAAPDGGATGPTGDGVSGNTGYTNLPGNEMPSCSVIATQYADTISAAQTCDVGASNQCQSLVPATLSACPVCMTYVNTTVTLATIKADWDKSGCGATPSGSCPALTCTQPTSGSCAAGSAGASCVSN